MVDLRAMTSIFECEEYMKKRYPPLHDSWSNTLHDHLPVVFCYAYTPTGRVSKFWCSLTFRCRVPAASHVTQWVEHERPRLKKGYRWSKPYWYMSPWYKEEFKNKTGMFKERRRDAGNKRA